MTFEVVHLKHTINEKNVVKSPLLKNKVVFLQHRYD